MRKIPPPQSALAPAAIRRLVSGRHRRIAVGAVEPPAGRPAPGPARHHAVVAEQRRAHLRMLKVELGQVPVAAPHAAAEIVRPLAPPRVRLADVVEHPVEHQADLARAQRRDQPLERRVAAEAARRRDRSRACRTCDSTARRRWASDTACRRRATPGDRAARPRRRDPRRRDRAPAAAPPAAGASRAARPRGTPADANRSTNT